MTTHTRDTLAKAHHQFYCRDADCDVINDVDYEFADFAMQQLAETETDGGTALPVRRDGEGGLAAAPPSPAFVYSEAFVVPLEDPTDRDRGEGDAAKLGLACEAVVDGQQGLGTCSPEPPSGGAS